MVSLKRKVTLKTKIAQEETPEAVESLKVSLKKKQPDALVTPVPKLQPTLSPKSQGKSAPTAVPQTSQVGKKPNIGRIIVGVVAIVVIIISAFLFINNGKENGSGNDKTSTGMTAQNGGKQDASDDASAGANNEGMSEEGDGTSANEVETSAPTRAEEIPAAKELTSAPSTETGSKDAEQSIKQNPASTSEISKSTASQATESTTSSNAYVGDDVEENARRVIRGDFGNGQVRKDKLGEAYSDIQRKVNEMYRKGELL